MKVKFDDLVEQNKDRLDIGTDDQVADKHHHTTDKHLPYVYLDVETYHKCHILNK